MAHLTARSSFEDLVVRLNRLPQGAPPSETLFKILKMLFSEREAGYVAQLPIKGFTVEKAAQIWKVSLAQAQPILDTLAEKGILLDVERKGKSIYQLPPTMAGFFEFSLMRVREDIDQKVLSELFHQYLEVEDDFVHALFRKETQMGRIFVNEQALQPDISLQVLDYERASEVIKTARHIAVGMCYCRHKEKHLGAVCEAPMHNCMSFGSTATALAKHQFARIIDQKEGLDLLQEAYDHNLVQFGENVRKGVSHLCNCCSCCCGAMKVARKFGFLHPVHTTNYQVTVNSESCKGCGKCVDVCPVEALQLVSAHDPNHRRKKTVQFSVEKCLGCGVCIRNCTNGSLQLEPREEKVIPPLSTVHRMVVMAIERGQLEHLFFDDRSLWNHRVMAAILGVILRLPPAKQILASQQVKSRYLEYLLSR